MLFLGVTGLLARLAGILAGRGIALFAISTFDTDWILIRAEKVLEAVKGFQGEGIKTEVLSEQM